MTRHPTPGPAAPAPSTSVALCRLAAAVAAAAAIGASACVSATAVDRYAGPARTTTTQYKVLARDLYESCTRFRAYPLQREGEGWYDEAAVAAQCAGRDSAVAAALRLNGALTAYLAALSALAGDKVAVYDGQVGALQTALVDDAKLNKVQVGAALSLVGYASRTLTDGYRRRELRRAITTQDANVDTVARALRDILDKDYRQALAVETAAMNNFYRTALREGRAGEPLAAVLVRDERDRRAVAARDRVRALDAYVAALDGVRLGHHALYARRNRLTAPELVGEIAVHARAMQDAADQLRSAF